MRSTASFTQDDIFVCGQQHGLAANAADPHFWFDVKLYEKACDEAAKALIEKIPAHEKEIRANLDAYRTKLEALDAEIRSTLAEIRRRVAFWSRPTMPSTISRGATALR